MSMLSFISAIPARDTIRRGESLNVLGGAANRGGALEADFPEGLDEKGRLLMDALVMGIRDVEQQYGSGYVSLTESVTDGK